MTKNLKDMPKNHDEKFAKKQADVATGENPDKIGSITKDDETSKIIEDAVGKADGTGHSTAHVTGAPQVSEAAKASVTVGQMVTYREGDYEISAEGGGTNPEGTNGTRLHPAMVTRVWSGDCVNLTVFFDMNPIDFRAGVMKLGVSYDEVPDGVQTVGGNACWF